MKKYLITSAAALALCGLITSCTHDIDGLTPEESVAATYEKAFITAFGQPAPDQTWGFGPSVATTRAMTRAKGDYVNYKGTMEPVEWYQENGQWKSRAYTFPSDVNNSYYLADVPNGVLKYTQVAGENQTGYASGTSYLDPSWTNIVNIWGAYIDGQTTGGTLYIKGNNDFSNRQFEVAINTVVYLLEGATLTLNDAAASTIKYTLYMASGSRLVASGDNGKIKLDGGKIYSHGTIECKSFEVNNTGLLYNVGTLTTQGEIKVANYSSVIVNDGTITSSSQSSKAGQLVTAGSGRVQNNGEWTVYGETIVNSNGNIWVNNGHFTTENFTYTATSSSVINNCFLTVNNNFCMNISDGKGVFKIDAGGGVLTKNFYGGGDFTAKDNNGNDVTFQGGPFRIDMGSRAVFKVTGTAVMNALGSGIVENGYGFHGVGSDYAVLQAKNITKTRDGEGNVAYGGKLYVSAETHFAQGYSGQYPFIHYQNGCTEKNIYATGFESGVPDISISETPCNPGFNVPDEPTGNVVRVVAEDLTATTGTDFDFNDVVFDVELKDNDRVYIYLRAAGGTLPLYIGEGAEIREVHELFGKDTNIMINTGAEAKEYANSKDDLAPVGFSLPNPLKGKAGADDVKQVAKAIKLHVRKNVNGVSTLCELTAVQGQAPAKLCVGTDFKYTDPNNGKEYPCLTERTDIKGQFKYMPENNHPHKGEGKFPLYVQKIFGDDWYKPTAEPLPESNN